MLTGCFCVPADIRFAGADQQPLSGAAKSQSGAPRCFWNSTSSKLRVATLGLGFVCTALELLLGAPAEVTARRVNL